MKYSEESEYEKQPIYKQPLDYESVLVQQMNRIATALSNNDNEKFYAGVDTLICILPRDLRHMALEYKKNNNIIYDLSMDGKRLYIDLWQYCNNIMEEGGMIFKLRYIKTFH